MATYAQRRLAGEDRLKTGREAGRGARRGATRERLLESARSLFLSRDYFELAVDDIARDAGVSRAAFYLHYPNKDAILVDIVREESTRLDPLYRWFEPTPKPSKERVRTFVQLAIRLSKRSRRQMSLFYQAASYNQDVWRTFTENRTRHIDMVGESVAAFRDEGRPAAVERRRRARAQLLFYQLEQLMLYASFVEDLVDQRAETDALAEAFEAFISEFAKSSAGARAKPAARASARRSQGG